MCSTGPPLLPYILDLLSRQPGLQTSVDMIEAHIRETVLDECVAPFRTLNQAVRFTLEVGKNLGLLKLIDEKVSDRINFRLRRRIVASPDGKGASSVTPSVARRMIRRRMKMISGGTRKRRRRHGRHRKTPKKASAKRRRAK
ncbi:hypothetical protein KR018_011848 [Drosophila ironensis]|nr:hypothetical protein KR018_011848 [Drosophila ironensis]